MSEEKKKITIRPLDTILEEDKDKVIFKHITPSAKCVCCNVPGVSVKINRAYLNGFDYQYIIDTYSDEVQTKTGSPLRKSTLSEHFSKHFNDKGAAIAEYNRKCGMNNLPVEEKQEMQGIFKALVDDRINELELFEMTVREQIKRLQELENIKKNRIEEKRTHNIEALIMKQQTVIDNLQTQVLTKFKIIQKAILQSKQMEVIDKQLEFLDQKTANVLGVNIGSINMSLYKEAEQLYLNIVIKNLVERIKKTVSLMLNLTATETTQFFKELKMQFKGIEDDINSQFRVEAQKLNQK